ncbi:MAG TPA: tetratricopeptide repeat protein, partial [Solirubrobacterales bacterium]|nr:tetratricopeptide repeat protein [Solirubrobacterales bacterium]
AMRLVLALWGFWFVRGYLAEGHRWLQEVLAATPEPTYERAMALIADCMLGFRRSAYGQIPAQAAESGEISRRLDDHAGMLAAVEVTAAGLAIIGQRGELEALVQEHERLSGPGLPPERAAIWAANTRGVGAWLRNDYRSARRGFEGAQGVVAGIEADTGPVMWPVAYGLVLVDAEIPHPVVLQEETVVLGRRVGAEGAAAHLLVNLAAVDRAEGAPGDAEERLQESIARFRRVDDLQGEALALNAWGHLASQVGDFDRGRDLFERSLAMREGLGDRRAVGLTLGGLGVLLARSGDADGGRAMAERCHRWFSHDDDQIGLSSAELFHAYMALHAGDLSNAGGHLKVTLQILDRMSPVPQQGWSAAGLAWIAIENGDQDEARGWIERALPLFERAGDQLGIARCRRLEREAGIGPAEVS